MAQFDTSVYQNLINIKSPESYAAERQQLQAGELTNALSRQKADAYGKEQSMLNAFRSARQRGASADELVGMGDYEGGRERQTFETNKVDESRKAEKWTQDRAKFVLGVQKDLAGRVLANPTGQSAMDAIAEMERVSGQNMDSERQKIAMLQSPDQIKQWAAGHALSADQLLPKFDTLNTGDSVQDRMRDPVTGAVTITGKSKLNMAPGAAAQLGLQRDQFEESKRHNRATEGIASIGAAQKASGGKVGAPTEDERKAAGWFAQAENSWKNMQAAMGGADQKTGEFKNPDVARPGVADAIAAVPSFGLGEVVGNTLRSPERQKFMQASSSLSEAVLRAATGAGVNRDEAAQKVRELTPVFGEDPATTKQKMDSIPMYLKSLKDRAGRAAPQTGGATGQWGGWSIQEVK